MDFIDKIKFDAMGLVPVIIQDFSSGEVLMMAYMNKESLKKTLETKNTWFWSRSRGELWNKGATSGNTQAVKSIYYDCDGDTILVKVSQEGNACHTGERTCFFNEVCKEDAEGGGGDFLLKLYDVIRDRKLNPKGGSYTNYLFDKGIDKILKKVGEEAAETIIAAKNSDEKELIYESSDLIYHLLVLLNEKNIPFSRIIEELQGREKAEIK